MKVMVNKDECIGCGACMGIAEDVFEMDDNGLSQVKVDTVPEDKVEDVKEAVSSCPTSAIQEVTE